MASLNFFLFIVALFSFIVNINCGKIICTINDSNNVDGNDVNATAKNQNDDKVRIDLYYESLCNGCIRLYTEQLSPLWGVLKDHINLYTYPFGNAKVIKQRNKTTFKCQHGPKECYGNALQACAIRYVSNNSQMIPFTACLMKGRSTDTAAKECGNVLNVDSKDVTTCAKSDEAAKLLEDYAKKTAELKDRKYVPYVLINDKVMDPNKRLMESVCAAFKKAPKECDTLV